MNCSVGRNAQPHAATPTASVTTAERGSGVEDIRVRLARSGTTFHVAALGILPRHGQQVQPQLGLDCSRYAAFITNAPFCPPNPKLVLIPHRNLASRADKGV